MQIRVRQFPERLSAVLGSGETHVWTARLDEPPRPVAELIATLDPQERERGDRYKHPAIRDQFLRARGLLRVLLGGYLGIEPSAVGIALGPDGKPGLDDCGVEYNVSHSRGVAAFAVSDRPVGIDIEAVRAVPSADGLVRRYFGPGECERYFQLPDDLRPMAFLRAWTCKEALLKAHGCGARGLDQCEVEIDPRERPRVLQMPGMERRWCVNCWEPAPGFLGAVAICGVESASLEKV